VYQERNVLTILHGPLRKAIHVEHSNQININRCLHRLSMYITAGPLLPIFASF